MSSAEQVLAASAYRLLVNGRPVRLSELAAEAGCSVATADAWLADAPGVFLDDEGRLIGFWGLAVEAVSVHRVDVGGRVTWAWCALDPLLIATVIGAELQVESVCPSTGQAIGLVVTPTGASIASDPNKE